MEEDSKKGGDAFWWAGEPVRELILEQGKLRVESTLATLTSLNSRLSSVGALLFAGAALTTTVATNVDRLSYFPILIATFAASFFAAGGLASFVGLASSTSVFAGEPPSWWAKNGLEQLQDLSEADAKYWIAQHHEAAISTLAKAVARRAMAFNVAIGLGAVGGVLIPVAACAALLIPKSAAAPPPATMNLTIRLEPVRSPPAPTPNPAVPKR